MSQNSPQPRAPPLHDSFVGRAQESKALRVTGMTRNLS